MLRHMPPSSRASSGGQPGAIDRIGSSACALDAVRSGGDGSHRRRAPPARGPHRRAVAVPRAVPQRAAVGHGARGLQRQRRRLVVLHPRPGPLARLPLGRGRAGRDLRRPPAAVLRAGAVERAGPDPQGAAVRPDQRRGQPRRGRQGVLLLRRQPADPQPTSGGCTSTRRPRSRTPTSSRRTPGARATRWSTSCSTPASSTTTATSTSRSTYAKAGPDDLVCRITVHNRGPDAAPIHVLPTLWFRNTWSFPPHTERAVAAPRRRLAPVVRADHHELGTWHLHASRRRRAAVLRQRVERRPPVAGRRLAAVPEGRHRRPRRCTARRPSTPPARGPRSAAHVRLVVPGRRVGGDVAPPDRRATEPLGRPVRRRRRRSSPPAAPRPTSSTPPSRRRLGVGRRRRR